VKQHRVISLYQDRDALIQEAVLSNLLLLLLQETLANAR